MSTNAEHIPSGRSIGVTVGLAVLGYVSTAMHTLRAQQHRGRVERVNEQLKALYGPLLACVTASKASYNAMLRQAGVDTPAKFREAMLASPSGPTARAYRTWVRVVLMPLSEKAAQLVMDRADLLENSGIEPLLLQLVSHVSAYKVILRQWEEGVNAELSAIPYPDDIHAWVSDGFAKLKRRQAALLGIAADGTQGSPLMRLIASKL
jgi:hypothetical protein